MTVRRRAQKRCICNFLPNVMSPGHEVKCPVHPRGRKLKRQEREEVRR